jgi:hypothetical protein
MDTIERRVSGVKRGPVSLRIILIFLTLTQDLHVIYTTIDIYMHNTNEDHC